MQLEITCPECGKRSMNPFDRVPAGKLRTTCHGCGSKFSLDKGQNLNCKVVDPNQKIYAENGWVVEHPACQGMQYDVDGIAHLIRSGMVNPQTRVSPPGERGYFPVSKLPQFKKALGQWEQKNARSQRG